MKYFFNMCVWVFVITMAIGYVLPAVERMVSCQVAENPILRR